MKLIVEKDADGRTFCYRETEKHFKRRGIRKVDHEKNFKIIDREGNLAFMDDGTTLIFDLKGRK